MSNAVQVSVDAIGVRKHISLETCIAGVSYSAIDSHVHTRVTLCDENTGDTEKIIVDLDQLERAVKSIRLNSF